MTLERLLRPRSIAVVGGDVARQVAEQCIELGFEGPIWPVNPRRAAIAGLPCRSDLASLPEAPDAAFLAVPREATVDCVAELAAMGAGGAIAYASGFGEAADGGALEAKLVENAGAMPVLGPNGYGLLNYLDGAGLWLEHHGGARRDRGVAIIAQSSNIAINLTCLAHPLPLAYVIALGNATMVGAAAAIDAVAADPRVSAIGLYLEGIDDPAALDRAIRAARAEGKPTIVLEVGASATAAERAATHSASLTGAIEVARAFYANAGAHAVRSLEGFVQTLSLLDRLGPAPDGSIACASCSGGEAALAADRIAARRLTARPFTEEERSAIARTVHPLVEIANPFDYHTFDWTRPERLERTFEAMMRAGQATSVLIVDPPASRAPQGEWLAVADAFARAANAIAPPARAAILSSHPSAMTPAFAERIEARGLVALAGLEAGFDALEAAASLARAPSEGRMVFDKRPASGAPTRLDEAASKALLERAGVATPARAIASDVEGALACARRLGFPIAIKALDAQIPHKNVLDALALDLRDEEATAREAERILALCDRILLERYLPAAASELLVGAARDPAIGLHFVLGAGGILTEIVRDTAILPLSAAESEIETALDGLRIGPRLRRKADWPAMVATIVKIFDFVRDNVAMIHALDVNPLWIGAPGRGAVAVDALIEKNS